VLTLEGRSRFTELVYGAVRKGLVSTRGSMIPRRTHVTDRIIISVTATTAGLSSVDAILILENLLDDS
jgi:hypothetical protein